MLYTAFTLTRPRGALSARRRRGIEVPRDEGARRRTREMRREGKRVAILAFGSMCKPAIGGQRAQRHRRQHAFVKPSIATWCSASPRRTTCW
jgi:hypothetical protein